MTTVLKPLHHLATQIMLMGGLALALIFSSLHMYQYHQWQLHTQYAEANVKLKHISTLVKPLLAAQQLQKLSPLIQHLQDNDADIQAITIKTSAGEVFIGPSAQSHTSNKHVFHLQYSLYLADQRSAEAFMGEVQLFHINRVTGWPWQRFLLAMIAICIASTLIVAMLTQFVKRTISAPLTALAQTADNLTLDERYDQQIDVRGYGEIHRLSQSLNAMLAAVQQRDSQLRAQTKELHQRANFDALTRLPNRYQLYEQLDKMLLKANLDNSRVALLLIDLDRFKVINDSLGHIAGDKLLQTAVERIRSALSEQHFFARWGGDEFVIALPQLSDTSEAETLAKHILQSLSASTEIRNQTIYMAASIGISIFPDHATTRDELISCADIGMYTSKAEHSNAFTVYTPSKHLSNQLILENKLRHALHNNAFSMVYQPKLCGNTGKILGLEALARWHDAELGDIPPSDFIPLAEELDLINDLSHLLFNIVDHDFSSWQRQGLPLVPVAVNLSPSTFVHPRFFKDLEERLSNAAIPVDMFEIEITEEVFLLNNDAVINTLSQLCKLGIKLALDDFGTRYSTLQNLATLPLNTLKIDRAFIAQLENSTKNQSIVAAIINLAHGLSLDVVAEGVETQAQFEFLKTHGCTQVQGFYFHKPMTATACAELLST